MNYPKVSVVIAASRDKPLYEDSLKRQECPNYEIVPIGGYTAARARNIGIKRAKGEIIALIDDDVVLPYTWMTDGCSIIRLSCLI